jgi:hypothetical protein
MLKQAIPLGIIGILALTLIAGSVIILARPAEADTRVAAERYTGEGQGRVARDLNEANPRGQGYGRGSTQAASQAASGQAERREGGLGQGQGRQAGTGEAGIGTNGSLGSGNAGTGGQGAGSRAAETYADPVAWTTITGSVLIADSELTVKTEDGEVVVGLGQATYREAQGFTVSVGDDVRVEGYDEDGEFKAGVVENLTNGQTITLRDGTGRPMWAGQGQRQN